MKPLHRITAATLVLVASLAQAQVSHQYRAQTRGLVVTAPEAATPAAPSPAPAPTEAQAPTTYLLQASTTSLSFGQVPVGQDALLQVLLDNVGLGTVSLQAPQTTGADFSSTSTCGASLAPGASCLTQVRFLPSAAGAVSGSLRFSSSAVGSPLLVTLAGTGVQAVGSLVAQSSSDFGPTDVGSAATRSFTFTNSGNLPATDVAAVLTGANLAFAANTCGTPGATATVAAGASCVVTVQWSPASPGALGAASLSVTSSAANSPSSMALSGTAQAVVQSDANWSGVTLLLGGGDTAGATSFADESPANTAVTRYGQTHANATMVRSGATSLYFDGAGDYLRADGAISLLTTASMPWTMEAWIYPVSHGHVFAANRKSDGANTMLVATTGATLNGPTVYDYPDFPLNQWSHMAVTYDGSTLRVFRDGAQVYSRTYAINNTLSNCVFGIGAEFDTANGGTPGNYFKGYLDEIRVTPGVARYTAGFTVVGAPFPRQ